MSKTILILGGNGFIGAECVEYLLDNNDDYNLILVNRNNWDDWDTRERIKSRIKLNIKCDRKTDSLKDALKDYLDNEDFKFEAVIDFSAYKSRVIKNFFQDIPSEKVKLYILISTDSVYEVSEINRERENLILYETDSVRPENKSEREKLKELDSYGHHKLKCEEELLKQKSLSYVILRLPDVIGKRDSTNRFWFYQMYLEFLEYKNPGQKHEIEISKFYLDKKTSYVYVGDVAKVIKKVLDSNVKNEIFNLGYDETLTIGDVLSLIGSFIKPGLADRIKCVPVENCAKYIYEPFPSVTKGPVSTEKVKQILGFEPSNLNETFKESVEFYKDAYEKFESDRRIIEKELKNEWIKSKNEQEKFKNFINSYIKK
ncbi:unnamed protein product [Brachionus calyciflorus]|uniref:NAD-dependent epimerase/dehydratase domain-containing protein n=1 Tax=Brachionus calyciflorus TaxID=104777 RepID=A0A813TYZ8_9BILA|nr:unnamed protein product [Brachionus calyciflorus]